eukprot:scaffold136658_cov20-Tisochrysis_lutea.AAC.1
MPDCRYTGAATLDTLPTVDPTNLARTIGIIYNPAFATILLARKCETNALHYALTCTTPTFYSPRVLVLSPTLAMAITWALLHATFSLGSRSL